MSDTKIVVGETVSIVVAHKSNLLPSLFPNEPTKLERTGTLLESAAYDPKDSIRITGDTSMPVRVISKERIRSFNGGPFKYTPTVASNQKSIKDRIVDVAGSKGSIYQVTIKANGTKSCTCVGYGFKGSCKHLDMAK